MPEEELPGGSFDACVATMQDDGHDTESAENICGALLEETKSDHGNVEELRSALEQGAGLIADVGVDLVSGVDVPAIDSKWVAMKHDGDDGPDYRMSAPLLKADDSDQRITYAAAMIPRELDKEGDVAPTPTVEKAAHGFLKGDGGIDTDHSLIDGEGDPVESWVLKTERTFDLPDGGTETYPEGTWMLGVEWGKEAWDRIQAGELTGLSIYGMAEHVPLGKDCGCSATAKEDPCWEGYTMVGTKIDENGNEVPNCVPSEDVPESVEQSGVPLTSAAPTAKELTVPFADEVIVDLVYGAQRGAEKAAAEMGMDETAHEHTLDDRTVWMPGPDHETYVETYNDLAEADGDAIEASLSDTNPASGDTHKGEASESSDMAPEQTGDDGGGADDGGPTVGELASSVSELTETVESVKESIETEKQEAEEAAAIFAEEYDMGAGAIMDIMEAAMGRDPDAIMDAIESIDRASDGDGMGDDEDDEEMESDAGDGGETESTEKRADEAYLGKGGDARSTAAKGVNGSGSTNTGLSYRAVAEQEVDQ